MANIHWIVSVHVVKGIFSFRNTMFKVNEERSNILKEMLASQIFCILLCYLFLSLLSDWYFRPQKKHKRGFIFIYMLDNLLRLKFWFWCPCILFDQINWKCTSEANGHISLILRCKTSKKKWRSLVKTRFGWK